MRKGYVEVLRSLFLTKTPKAQQRRPAKAVWLLGLLLAATALNAQTVLNISGATTGTWTAPATGGPFYVRITAKGGDGGLWQNISGTTKVAGGQGATLSGIFKVEAGQTIRAISGAGGGWANPDVNGGAGGGGGAGAVNASTGTLLLLAGGGGGARQFGGSGVGASATPGDGSGGDNCRDGGGGGGLNEPGVNATYGAAGGGQVSLTGVSAGGGNGGSGMGGGGGGDRGYGGGGGGQTGGSGCIVPAGSQPGGECQSNTAGGTTTSPQGGYVTFELLPTAVFYRDADGDGYGDAATTTIGASACTPAGYVSDNTDCNDGSGAVNPTTIWVLDADNDGYYTGDPVTQCAVPGQGYAVKSTQQAGDCNDGDATVHSPQTYYVDADKDGFGSTATTQLCSSTATDGYSTNNTDCNDGDATVHSSQTYYYDADGDGFGNLNNPTSICLSTPPQGYVANSSDCNDAKVLYADNDGDGFGAGAPVACGVANNTDCNDSDPAIKPTTVWVLDADGDGYYTGNPITQCTSPGAGYAIKGSRQPGDCNDGNMAVHPNAPEICGNGIDDNCNGQIDENCGPCRNATNLTTTSITTSGATLTWTAPATPQQWQVEYKSLSTGSKWITITVSGTARSLTLSSLLSNNRYKWNIRARCNGTWTAYSSEVQFTTLATIHSSITQAKAGKAPEEEMLVIPNLLRRSQIWSIPSLPAQNTITVMDLNGHMVLQAHNYQNGHSFSNISSGIYFYQILIPNNTGKPKVYQGKLVITD